MHTTDDWALAIHGGAGMMARGDLSAADDAGARAGLRGALDAGAAVLAGGGAALDAVAAAITVLEDDPHFNAGRGAALTADGIAELDAAIMDGAGRTAGSVAGVTRTRHPIALARAVMATDHVLLAGPGADAFARTTGLEQVPNAWFRTAIRQAQLAASMTNGVARFDKAMKYGTVGAVARDAGGHVAAGTSTGGVTGKRWGRIGDSPLIGAGTYADDRSGAVSATGSGEYFIRAAVAHEICARIRLAGATAADAARGVLADIDAMGGAGGVIVMPVAGAPVWSFTTPGLYRGQATAGGATVAIYGDEN